MIMSVLRMVNHAPQAWFLCLERFSDCCVDWPSPVGDNTVHDTMANQHHCQEAAPSRPRTCR